MTFEEIRVAENNKTIKVTGYIAHFDFATSEKGTKSITGMVHLSDGAIGFRIWAGELYNKLKAEPTGGVFEIVSKMNIFNGVRSLIITELTEAKDQDYTHFMKTPYDKKVWWSRLMEYANMLTPEGKRVFKEFMNSYDYDDEKQNYQLFLVSTASVSHHDATVSGLLAHSVKVADIALKLLSNYPAVEAQVNKDILILGSLFHDIGKLIEYDGFSISEVGKICSHLSLGVDWLGLHRDLVMDQLGVEGYYRLQSVITQHHGEFGDRPRTFEAYLVHKADMLEASLTALNEKVEMIEDSEVAVRDGNTYLKLH